MVYFWLFFFRKKIKNVRGILTIDLILDCSTVKIHEKKIIFTLSRKIETFKVSDYQRTVLERC